MEKQHRPTKHHTQAQLKEEMEIEKALQIRSKYLIIRDLCFILKSLLPQEKTKNTLANYDNLLCDLSQQEKGLVLLLTHQMTLLHQTKRIKEGGCWQSEAEDLLFALQLIGRKLHPIGFISPKKKSYYIALENYFGSVIFRREEALHLWGLKKTQTCRLLNEFSEKGLLYKHKRKGCLGYLYQIMKSE